MKRMLVLEASGNAGEPSECKSICVQAELYGINVVYKCVKDNNNVEEVLQNNGSFDYVYLSQYGGIEGLSSKNKNVDMDWSEFATKLFEYDCLKEDCIIMFSCSRGELNAIADTLFMNCGEISFIVGPRQSLNLSELLISFGIFLYNVEVRRIDPVVACEKIKAATDIRFNSCDRVVWDIL